LAWFHSGTLNIDPIPNLSIGDEIRHQSAHFMYTSCGDTIRIQILNLSQRCWNRKIEWRSGSNPSPHPVGTPVFWVTTWTEPSGPVPNADRSRVTQNHCLHYSCFKGSFLLTLDVLNIKPPSPLEICRVILEIR
jgi:hypothetical protein